MFPLVQCVVVHQLNRQSILDTVTYYAFGEFVVVAAFAVALASLLLLLTTLLLSLLLSFFVCAVPNMLALQTCSFFNQLQLPEDL